MNQKTLVQLPDDLDPVAETIKNLQDVIADIQLHPDKPPTIVFSYETDGGVQIGVCGIHRDIVHMLHSEMCHNDDFAQLIEHAVVEHELCKKIRGTAEQTGDLEGLLEELFGDKGQAGNNNDEEHGTFEVDI